MSLVATTEQQQWRYLTDGEFHTRVDVVAHALWHATCRFGLGLQTPYPYERLIEATKSDLIGYAIAAVEALETFDGRESSAKPETAERSSE